jgi:hypothetical protein
MSSPPHQQTLTVRGSHHPASGGTVRKVPGINALLGFD